MFGRRTSKMWTFFTEIDTQHSICNICKLKVSHKTTTSNLQKHLKNRHPSSLTCSTGDETRTRTRGQNTEMICSLESQPSTSSSQSEKTTQDSGALSTNLKVRVESVLPKRSKNKIDRTLLSLFICDLQPFSIVEDRGFKELVSALNPGYQLPSRFAISNTSLPAMYEECLKNTKVLVSRGKKFCITTDTWTSMNTVSFIGVTVHFVDDNFNLNSVLLECSSCDLSDSKNLAAELQRVTQEWGIQNKIIFAVSDNDANIQKAIRDVGWENMVCLAHTINSLVEYGLANENIQEIIGKIREIVKHFRRSKVISSDKLSKFRENFETIPLKLILDVPNRWNSTFYMLERFIHLEEAVKSTVIEKELPVLTAAEWEIIKELCQILKPFQEVTTILSGEKYCTSSLVIPICDGLKHILEEQCQKQISEPVMDVVRRLRLGFEERLGNVESISTLGISSFLDPKFKYVGFSSPSIAENVQNDIIRIIAERMTKEREGQNTVTAAKRPKSVEENENKNMSIWGAFDRAVAAVQPKDTSDSQAIMEMHRYVEKAIIPRQHNSLLWWQLHKDMFPYLSKIAQETLCTMATSVPCERLYSKAGQVIPERRNRLSNRKTQMILFLNANMQYLRNG